MLETILFIVFAAVAVVCGVGVVVQTHPIRSAISLIGVMGALAVLYLTLGGEFIAAVQVLVYAGAVMVLFVFVIMLLNAEPEKAVGRSWPVRILGIPLLIVFLGVMSFLIQRMFPDDNRVKLGEFIKGSPRDLGELLFTDYLLPFEVTSVLILVAIIGAVVLARKEAS